MILLSWGPDVEGYTGSELRFSGISGFHDNALSKAVVEDLAHRIYARGEEVFHLPQQTGKMLDSYKAVFEFTDI